jgi:NAD(P)-dependent dehydrogenase (short-subunit alcohol dehydrogenase family)
MPDLKDTPVFITGASRGIGRALTLRCADQGARLAFCGRDAEALHETARAARERGAAELMFSSFDLMDTEATVRFYREAVDRMGVPGVLINNAGLNTRKAPLWEYSLEEFERMMGVNVRAAFLLMQLACRDMMGQKKGTIVNILSTVCLHDMESVSVYTASKKALQGLTDVLRKEAREHQVRVISIYPGGTDTEFRAQPRPSYMQPSSVAEAVFRAVTMPDDLVVHHMTFRPMVETNF